MNDKKNKNERINSEIKNAYAIPTAPKVGILKNAILIFAKIETNKILVNRYS